MIVTTLFSATFLITYLLIYQQSKREGIGKTILLAGGLRFILCTTGIFITLPFGGLDGVKFERIAWEWSQGSFKEIIQTFDPGKSYLISSITALFYKTTERNIAIPIYINGIIGLFIIYYSMKLAKEIWPDRRSAQIVGIALTLHPLLNLNSAIVLRENYVILFITLAALHLCRHIRNRSLINLILYIIFTLIATAFHGGMIVFMLALPTYLITKSKSPILLRTLSGALLLGLFLTIIGNLEIGKLRSLQEKGLSVEYLAELEENRREANTAYLTSLPPPSSVIDIIWQAPLRVIYLLASPFPWNLSEIGHSVVLLDAIAWWMILYIGWRNRKEILQNPSSAVLLFGLLFIALAFAYGTENFGTAFRHRTKFLVLAVIITSPFFYRFSFRKPILHQASKE